MINYGVVAAKQENNCKIANERNEEKKHEYKINVSTTRHRERASPVARSGLGSAIES
jgi:hypothetical protein